MNRTERDLNLQQTKSVFQNEIPGGMSNSICHVVSDINECAMPDESAYADECVNSLCVDEVPGYR